jgi:tetratricopeptide (TPR) repeat protein
MLTVSAQATEGVRLMQQGALLEAARAFERALAQDPRDGAALLGLARLRLARGENGPARTLLGQFLEVSPAHPEARSHLARLDAEAGDARALEVLRELTGRLEAGFFEFLNYGRALLAHHLYDQATAALTCAQRLQPDVPHVLTYLGMARRGQGRHEQAMSDFLQAAAQAPRESFPLLLAARLLTHQGQTDRALGLMRQALERAADKAQVYPELIKLILLTGDAEGAAETAAAFRKHSPRDGEAAYLHGLATLLAGKLPEAGRILRETLVRAPSSVEARVALANVRRLSNDAEGAWKLLEEAHRLDPRAPAPACELAVRYLSAPGGKPRAVRVLTPALATHPEDANLNLNMALALADTEPSRALVHARRATASPQPALREQAERLLALLS